MKYMLLIYHTDPLPDDAATDLQPWVDYGQALLDAGAMVAGDPLEGPHTATTVRVRDGHRTVTDGPFAETKEVLGGYYLIDTESLDDALDWAAKCPAATYGSMEVRPVMEFEMPS